MPTTDEHRTGGSTAHRGVAASAFGVVKTFSPDVQALRGLDFSARFGEVTALIGANGSGKSTLLKILFGLLRPDTGDVRTLDLDPVRQSRAVRAQAAYVSQPQALDPEMTCSETLALFCALYGLTGSRRSARIAALIEAFGLEEVSRRRVAEYSGGFRQRLHLAIGLIPDPRLLLLDEPTSGLDPQGRSFLWETMQSYACGGRAVLVVTHDLEQVTRHADRVVLLARGQALVDAPPRDVIAQHGRTVLEITLDQPPQDWEPLRCGWQALEGVDDVQTRGPQALLRLQQRPELDAAILAVLKAADLEAASYRHERPNLSTAYFQLAGQALAVDAPPQNSGRGRRRK
jgi:ABC-2 type transport system ATP-binding protein